MIKKFKKNHIVIIEIAMKCLELSHENTDITSASPFCRERGGGILRIVFSLIIQFLDLYHLFTKFYF